MIKHHRLLGHNRFFLILSAFLLFVGVHPASPATALQPPSWTVLFHDDFEDGNAEGWGVSLQDDQARGWQVEMDGNNTVFAGQGFSTATLTLGRWYDYRFAARVKFIQSGIVLSFRQGLFSGYMVSFQADQMYLSRAVGNGMPSLVANAPGPFSADRWYDIEIIGIGANIKVYVDGVVKIDYTDPDPILFGGVSLSCPSGGYVLADDVELSGPPSPPEPVWIKTGGPLGGVGYDVRMRPDNFDSLYVTDTFSGVHMSADGGRTWLASNKGMTSRVGLSGDAIPVFCLTIDPHNHDIVWIGTQGTRTIFKSVDGGKTWVQKSNGIVEPANTTFRGFTVDPRTSDIVYAAAEGPPLATGKMSTLAAGVVYRTTDGGENWQVVWRGDSLARYIWINPQNPDVIYVSTGIFDREATNSNAAQNFAGGVGILKSVDGGLTWRALNQNNGLQNLYISSLFMHPQNPDILLAAAGNLGYWEGSGAYLSTDGGEHWQKTLSPSTLGLVELDPVTSVEFSVADPRIAYAGSQTTFWRSADGGYTWTVMSGGTSERGQLWYGPPGTAIGKPIDLQVDPRNPDRVFVNNYGGGNFLTEDGGKTWTNASTGYTGAEVWMVAVDSANPSRVFANAKSGPFRSDDGGANWKGMQFYPMGLDVQGGLALDPTNADRVLLGEMRSGKIFRSTDGGQSWDLRFNETKVNPGDCGVDNCNGFRAFAFAPSNPDVVYAGMRRQMLSIDAGHSGTSFGVYKSLDRGETWQPANDAHSAQQDINALVVDPRSADIAYAGTIAAGVLRTLDGGKSWAAVNLGLPLLDVRSLAIDPANPSVLYAGLERGALYKTADGGDHWLASGYGMDAQASVRALAIDPTNPNVLYAGDALTGCYGSQDAGQTWDQINDGLRMRAVMALAISSDGGTLYAATAGEGVFRLNTNLFSDIPSGYWAYNYIIAIYNNGITTGCVQDNPTTPANERRYCPEESVTRGQIAAFIIRAKYGETFSYTTIPYFTDVPSTHTFFKYVQKLRDDGITAVSGTYGVDNEVTRGQMAAFIIRAKFGENFSYTQTPYFSDVPSTHTFFKYVQKLKDDGITTVTGTYGVDNIVTRAQMAAFLARAFLGME